MQKPARKELLERMSRALLWSNPSLHAGQCQARRLRVTTKIGNRDGSEGGEASGRTRPAPDAEIEPVL